jgi:hypothetical protein
MGCRERPSPPPNARDRDTRHHANRLLRPRLEEPPAAQQRRRRRRKATVPRPQAFSCRDRTRTAPAISTGHNRDSTNARLRLTVVALSPPARALIEGHLPDDERGLPVTHAEPRVATARQRWSLPSPPTSSRNDCGSPRDNVVSVEMDEQESSRGQRATSAKPGGCGSQGERTASSSRRATAARAPSAEAAASAEAIGDCATSPGPAINKRPRRPARRPEQS